MAGQKLNIQNKIIFGAGNKPTIPNPSTILPDDTSWVDSTDILIGQLAYNVDDDIWYTRSINNEIKEISGSSGTTDHNLLTNRDAANQHPISAIEGLTDAITNKVDKVTGKGLSSNDYTNTEKQLLSSQSGSNTGDETKSTIESKGEIHRGDDIGSADVIQVTFSPAVTSLVDKALFYVKVAYANATTTPTLKCNALVAKTIVKKSGNALAVGDIQAGYYLLMYDSTLDKFHLMSPSVESTANLPDSTGKRYVTDAQKSSIFEVFPIACSDETSIITAKVAQLSGHWPCNFTVSSLFIGLNTASSSGSFILDFNDKNGASIFSTRPTILATEKTSLTNGTQPVIVTSTFDKGDAWSIDIDSPGTGAIGIKLYAIGIKS